MSKNTYLVFLILSLFAAGLTFYYGSTKASASLGKNLPVVVPASQYIANDLGVAFDYPAGANGYALKQPNMSIVPNLERLVVLSKKSDNVFNTIAGVSLEEPPTIVGPGCPSRHYA